MKLIDRLKQSAAALKKEMAVLAVTYKDSRTPWYSRVAVLLVIAYSLSPVDLIPDFIPVLGYLDDLILIPLGISLAIKLIPKEIIAEACEKVSLSPEETGISGWWFAAIIILFWLTVTGLIVKTFLQKGN